MQNMCSYGYAQDVNSFNTPNYITHTTSSKQSTDSNVRNTTEHINNLTSNEIFSINGDRLDVFGISINIDDLIILIMLFFMFRENQIDYSIIIILALILFDQS